MTLIATAVSQNGIVHAADGSLTSLPFQGTTGSRLFKVDCLSATVTISGVYEIGSQRLDDWMHNKIREYGRAPTRTLKGFADYLRERLSALAPVEARGRVVQIAGYVESGGRVHPEVYRLDNVASIAPDHSSARLRKKFRLRELFWVGDYRDEETRRVIASGGAHLYVNGFSVGRRAYEGIIHGLHELYPRICSSDRFHEPRTLEELAILVELDMKAIAALFAFSDYRRGSATPGLEIAVIPAPANSMQA